MRTSLLVFPIALALAACGSVAPVTTAEPDSGAPAPRQLSTTGNHTCFVDTVGVLRCFGNDASAQLGRGTSGGSSDVPVVVRGDLRWRSVAAGIVATCAIADDRTLHCWGGKATMEVVGLGTADLTTPTRVGTAADWDAISVGWNVVCGRHTGGKLDCFLPNRVETVDGGPGFAEVSASFYEVVALDRLGQTYLIDLDAQFPSLGYAPDAPRFTHVHQPVFGVYGLDASGRVARWTRSLGVETSQDGTRFVAVDGAYDVVAVASDGAIWLHSDQHDAGSSPLHLHRLDALGGGWAEVHQNATGDVCGIRLGRVACFRVNVKGEIGAVREIP